jgi:hypothetical protein
MIQALWADDSPFLQLPNFTPDLLRYCVDKKKNPMKLTDYAVLPREELKVRCARRPRVCDCWGDVCRGARVCRACVT